VALPTLQHSLMSLATRRHAVSQAGQYAWVCLLIVSFLLYGYRFILGEVVSGFPENGGMYVASGWVGDAV
jgi:hypothetical protein